ncbi:hypothetical protein IAQ61_000037 [Plenodomus lingam]|uniref:uncharacterized protein n=1 Tax=Leptosphaeria maculans TaxID=5022 RepID=UPI0033221CD8|nr:hypothetical protein IAQ61_000037 [Plenodomus lingam]
MGVVGELIQQLQSSSDAANGSFIQGSKGGHDTTSLEEDEIWQLADHRQKTENSFDTHASLPNPCMHMSISQRTHHKAHHNIPANRYDKRETHCRSARLARTKRGKSHSGGGVEKSIEMI